jgi:hypothetical protein
VRSNEVLPHFTEGLLSVDNDHMIYWRAHSNLDASVVAILHGSSRRPGPPC